MNDEKIMTKHTEGKQGVRIDKALYDELRKQILSCLKEQECTYTQMVDYAKKQLKDFKGSIGWYMVAVKQDLEASNVIERIPDTRPERYRIV
jgi:DNA-binding transcriptional ArsR family regulator